MPNEVAMTIESRRAAVSGAAVRSEQCTTIVAYQYPDGRLQSQWRGRWAVADTTSDGGVGRCCCTVEWTSNFMEPFISYEHNDCCLPIPPTDDHNSLLRYVSRTSDVYLSDIIFANYVVV
jgi:hypothetical protein